MEKDIEKYKKLVELKKNLRLEIKEKLEKGQIPYFPNIKKFDENTIHLIHPPKPINKFFYEEIYNKGILCKKDLIVGKYYKGKCRNANVARWNGNNFTYMRTKFNWCYPEDINHPNDDDGYDLFIPLYETTPTDYEIIKNGYTLKK